MHRKVKHKFQWNEIEVEGIDVQSDADLMDMGNVSKYNNGVKYVLVCKDIFLRYAWAQALKLKKSIDVIKAFQSVLQPGRRPLHIRTDKGNEFVARMLNRFKELKYSANAHPNN